MTGYLTNRLGGLRQLCQFALSALVLVLGASSSLALANTRYVWTDSPSPSSPYTNWLTAAHIIQDAVDVAVAGDTVWVTNGVYASGGRAIHGSMTNRVAITKALTVQSVNGPDSTFLVGKGPKGNGAIRCAYVTNGAVIAGFTLSNGNTRTSGDLNKEYSGGGVWCETRGVVSNCFVVNNQADYNGGGCYQGILISCLIKKNISGGVLLSGYGGGAYKSQLTGCRVVNNRASLSGGGVYMGSINNSVLSYNEAEVGGGVSGGSVSNSCIFGNMANEGGGAQTCSLYNSTVCGNSAIIGGGGLNVNINNCIIYFNEGYYCANIASVGYDIPFQKYSCTVPGVVGMFCEANITNEPGLVSMTHIGLTSACLGKGSSSYAGGVDIDGDAWSSPPAIGADEPRSPASTGMISVAIGADYNKVNVGFALKMTAQIEGPVTQSVWDFADGTVLTNCAFTKHFWRNPGLYPVVLTAFSTEHPSGISCTAAVTVVEDRLYCVDVANINPKYPYTTWESAATNIQDAILAGDEAGRQVMVKDGVYEAGGMVVYGVVTNRVALMRGVSVQSLNGPAVTVIKGSGRYGAGRCAYVGNDCELAGFTLANGATRSYTDDCVDGAGGGAWCELGGSLSNCWIIGNKSAYRGGGVYRGKVFNCRIEKNSTTGFWGEGGGCFGCLVINGSVSSNTATQWGGGGHGCVLDHCLIYNNSASASGGGTYEGIAKSCMIYNNDAPFGGGAWSGDLFSCVLFRNMASTGGGSCYSYMNNCTITCNSAATGGGVCDGHLYNCIVFNNLASSDQNWSGGSMSSCCSFPCPPGGSNISADPGLVSYGSISEESPCLGKGNVSDVSGLDIDDEMWRISPAIGADEPYAASSTGHLSVAIGTDVSSCAVGCIVPYTALVDGHALRNVWDFGDGCVVTNRLFVEHEWSTTGLFSVVLTALNGSFPSGVACTSQILVVSTPVSYVSASSKTPVAPYNSWATAATNIQDAVSADATEGRKILVADGVYDVGGVAIVGSLTNRVALSHRVKVHSVNGPGKTTIVGKGPLGSTAIRCAYVASNCELAGFTLSNGHTRVTGDADTELSGGGVWCEVGGVVSNCWIVDNHASFLGGGVYRGMLWNCLISGNVSMQYAGGGHDFTANNCVIISNTATNNGGGSYWGNFFNCTIARNITPSSTGGVEGGRLENSIVYYNKGGSYYYPDCSGGSLNYCCTSRREFGEGNITNPPAFWDMTNGDYRLRCDSPCINMGQNQRWMYTGLDLKGHSRIQHGTVDMGAYEFAFEAALTGLLQGPYNTNSHAMAAAIYTNLPASSPYASDNRLGSDIIPSNTVDWALVEVLDTNRNSAAAISVFLDSQGRVRDAAGGMNIPVEVSAGSYYLVLRHRNHLAAVSALPVAFTNTVISYDFTAGPGQYLGGTNACAELEPGVWGLIAGDADGDGKITPVDREIVRRLKGKAGYLQADVNLDGKVDGGDE